MFEQVFVCWIYFNSVCIVPVEMMLFSNSLADVNLDFFKYILVKFWQSYVSVS